MLLSLKVPWLLMPRCSFFIFRVKDFYQEKNCGFFFLIFIYLFDCAGSLVAACGLFQLQHVNFHLQQVRSSSLVRDQSPESQPLDHQGSPKNCGFFKKFISTQNSLNISVCSLRFTFNSGKHSSSIIVFSPSAFCLILQFLLFTCWLSWIHPPNLLSSPS